MGQDLGTEEFGGFFGDSGIKVNLAVLKGDFKGGNGIFAAQEAVEEGVFGKLGEIGKKGGHGLDTIFVVLRKTDFENGKR